MLIHLAWDNEAKTVLRYRFEQGWSWFDVDQALQTSAQMMSTVEHEVTVIMDLHAAPLLPKNILSQIVRAYERPNPPNLGATIVLSATPLLKMIMEAGRRVTGKAQSPWRLHFVQTEAEAYALIEQVRQNKH